MYQRSQIFAKPIRQLTFSRGVAHPGIRKPEFKKTTQTSHQKPSGDSASTIGNGIADKPIFPKGSIWRSYSKAIPAVIGGIGLALFVMYIWPVSIVKASDTIDSVPNRGDTAAVSLKGSILNKEPVVDIPQTYAHLDKTDDDE